MKNILLIVDPQNDFITGPLAVKGAKEKMLKLSDYIKDFKDEYDYIFVTLDTHPVEHCSFKENGGVWPSHCIFLTNGWHMPEYLSDAFDRYESFFVYNKGEHRDKEEYSIFQNERCGKILTQQLQDFQNQDEDTYVDVCGIAGDYCVLETIKGLKDIVNPEHISVLMDLVASIDGGEKLTEFLDNNGINYFNIGNKE